MVLQCGASGGGLRGLGGTRQNPGLERGGGEVSGGVGRERRNLVGTGEMNECLLFPLCCDSKKLYRVVECFGYICLEYPETSARVLTDYISYFKGIS